MPGVRGKERATLTRKNFRASSPSHRIRALVSASVVLYLLLSLSVSSFFYFAFWTQFQSGELFAHSVGKGVQISDFVQFYAAGTVAKEQLGKEKSSIYSPDLQMQAANRAISPGRLTDPFILQYPPYVYAFFAPLSYLRLDQAFIVWNAINLILFCVSITSFIGKVHWPRAGKAAVFLSLLGCWPLMYSLMNGQTAVWLLAGIAAFWLSLAERKFFLAGVCTALGACACACNCAGSVAAATSTATSIDDSAW